MPASKKASRLWRLMVSRRSSTSPAKKRAASPRSASKRSTASPRMRRPQNTTSLHATKRDGTKDKKELAQQDEGLRGDWPAIALLMLLYTLQGIPMGLSGSVPFLMQAKGISMTEQAKFSIVSWPFSLKLLWAPLVDSVYHGTIGRRKTWIIPVQAVIGFLLLWAGGTRIDGWLGEGGGGERTLRARLRRARLRCSPPCRLLRPRAAPTAG